MARAMDLGIADHGECARCEQGAQIAIALLAGTAKLVLATARVLLRYEPNPGREVASRSEGPGIGNARDQRCCQRRTDARNRVQPFGLNVLPTVHALTINAFGDAIQRLFVLALCREPSAAELQKFKNLMAEAATDKKANRREVLEDLFWAVLTSKEFLFNR